MTKKLTYKKKADLDTALRSGDPLTIEQLAWHLQINPKHAPKIAKSLGLQLEGRTYPWRRIWRHMHGTEGARLPGHLANLKAKHPDSMILGEIEDLEAALRVPLIDFATMAEHLGRKPDTLGKALRQGRETLPFQMMDLGKRLRHFRALEVRLWVQEEIALDLPQPPQWAIPAKETTAAEKEVATKIAAADEVEAVVPRHCSTDDQPPADPVKKAVFGHFEADSRNHPT